MWITTTKIWSKFEFNFKKKTKKISPSRRFSETPNAVSPHPHFARAAKEFPKFLSGPVKIGELK